MKLKTSLSRKIFLAADYIILALAVCLSLFPLIHILALSFSSAAAAAAGRVSIFPVDVTLDAYKYILGKAEFFRAFGISLLRVALGTAISLSLTILSAYAMSQPDRNFHARKYFVWVFLITMVFSGGMIPLFVVIKAVGIYNSIWALVLPGAVSAFNVVLMLNFFRGLPYALTESALIDGANHFQIMARIVVPISKPSLATVGLFTIVMHWNSWFDGMIYMSDTSKYPLQTYLRNVINSVDVAKMDLTMASAMNTLSQRTVTAAQIFIAIIPILLVYPALQKYFITGMTLGSVKE